MAAPSKWSSMSFNCAILPHTGLMEIKMNEKEVHPPCN